MSSIIELSAVSFVESEVIDFSISYLGLHVSSNDCNPRYRDLGLQLLCLVTLTFKLSRV